MRWLVALLMVLAVIRPAGAVSPKEATGAVFAGSDGRGEVRLVWFPPLGKWPAGGWQIQDSAGQVLIGRVTMAAPEAMQRMADKDREAIGKLASALARVGATDEVSLLYGMTGARAFGDWDYAQAIGLARPLTGVRAGRQSYRVIGLTPAGKPSGVSLVSAPVDAHVATPLPPVPPSVRAEASESGVNLYWQPVAPDRKRPVLAYHVERNGQAVTPRPLVRAARWPSISPALVDREAPREARLDYRIQAVDVFGRRGAAAEVQVFSADLTALQPPGNFAVKAGREEAKLTWSRSRNPNTAGYVVERSFLPEGPFEALTPEGLAASAESYSDRKLRPGTAYVYRLRAMGPRGDLGPPSRSAVAQPEGTDDPSRVDGLTADVGRTRVRLAWPPLTTAVAGYFIERRVEGGENWTRLNAKPQPEPFYEDYAISGNGSQLRYRVTAVGYDSRFGRPSSELTVSLSDITPPSPPYIARIDGADGRVRIEFAPTGPAEKSRQFLVLRGDTPAAEVVLGEPLSGAERRYEDAFVEPGQSYWYRLVALDGQGNRSEAGPAAVVRVGSPAVPGARRPEVEYLAEPFPHARVRYADPPQGLAVMLQYKLSNMPWIILAGPTESGGETSHVNLPSGDIQYRTVYRAADGNEGEPSENVQLKRR